MKNIFFSLIFSIILCSCNSPFNSSKKYYYMNKIDTEINKDYPDVDMPSYDPNDTEDPFNSKEEWNNINYKFNGNELYEYFMKISFDVHTVPIYSFFKPDDSRVWKRTQESYFEEYTFNASRDVNKT